MKDITINGTSVYIKSITYQDTELMVKWRNSESVSKYFIYRKEFTKETHENWMKNKVETGEVVQFIIYDNENNVPIGSTYLRDIDMQELSAEYGVLIGEEEYRAKGIGKEVLGLTIKYAFKELHLKRIIARVISDNKPSLYSFLHSGFEIYDEVTQKTIPEQVEIAVTMLEITDKKYEELNSNSCV